MKPAVYMGRVLVIDDVPGIRDRIARSLALKGYHCTFVDGAHEAGTLSGHEYFDTTVYGHEFLLGLTGLESPPRVR